MRVIVGNSVYEMNRSQFKATLKAAKKCVKCAIYAVEKDSICELKKELYRNKESLLAAVGKYVEKGFKVYYVS